MNSSKEAIIAFLKKRKSSFATEFSVEKLGLFGSYARGEEHKGSDIDIVVELGKPDLFYLIGIKQAVEDAMGVKVDVVRLRNDMNQVLKKRIERDVIYV
jgi:hypothetical protein